LKAQVDAARRQLVKGKRPPVSMAEELWTAGAKACGSMPPADAPLSRIMVRLIAR
jgi:hypothetical protein